MIVAVILALAMSVGLLSAFASGLTGTASANKDTSAEGTSSEDSPADPDVPENTDATDTTVFEEPEVIPQVTSPTLNINGFTLLIGVTDPAATSYDVYVDDVFKETVNEQTVNLWVYDLAVGTYEISVIAKADEYEDSSASTIDYTVTGYTVSFTDTEYGDRDPAEVTEATSATLRVYYSYSNYGDITVNGNMNLSVSYDNVVAVQLLADSTSKYLYYDMGSLHSYLYNTGSGYASERLHLVNDIIINVAIYEQQCIAADTLVLMADGSYKELGDIKTGDYVLSYDWETMQLVPNKVIYASSEEADWETGGWDAVRYYKHTFSDGTVIKQAFAHRFYNLEAQAFVYLEHWNIGDHTYDQDGDNPYLVKTETVYETIRYARITLENGTNYFANGLLTGDRNCPTGIILGGESS